MALVHWVRECASELRSRRSSTHRLWFTHVLAVLLPGDSDRYTKQCRYEHSIQTNIPSNHTLALRTANTHPPIIGTHFCGVLAHTRILKIFWPLRVETRIEDQHVLATKNFVKMIIRTWDLRHVSPHDQYLYILNRYLCTYLTDIQFLTQSKLWLIFF